MAVYVHRDIETSFAGDIEIDTNGDLKLANPLETYKAAANFLLRTDHGEYVPDATVGCNLGSFIGEMNTTNTHQYMEYNVNRVLKSRLFSSTDVVATVVAFDINEALCVVKIAGSYLIDNVIQSPQSQNIAYTFPFLEGESITPISIE